MHLALFQPDIPQNTGTILRLAACFGVPVNIIGPAGFDWSERALRRAGLDYLDRAACVRHPGWSAFEAWRAEMRVQAGPAVKTGGREAGDNPRLVLLTVHGRLSHTAFAFRPDDILLLGRESAGVPDEVHAAANARIRVPMRAGLRSLNVAAAAAVALGEALRQTGGFEDLR